MNLRELREANKKTVAEVAKVLGVGVNAIYYYERGIRCINIEQVLILSEFYDVGADDVIKAQINSRQKDQ